MKTKVPFLLFNMANQLLGLDCAEIKKVIMDLASVSARNIIDEFKQQKRYHNLWEIFKLDKKADASSFILIQQAESEEGILIEVPVISTIINIDVPRILVVPDYLKRKQEPFFVWGLVKNEAEMIILITFSFFNQIKDTHG